MKITVRCDKCGQETGASESSVGTTIAFGPSGERVIDLCDVCRTELTELLNPILARGVRPSSATGTATTGSNGNGRHRKLQPVIECPHCGKRISQGAGMTMHMRKSHPELVDIREEVMT
jgi:endogenous inhibitor of DNA gyrase (YacG/DUF329 family)